MPHSVSDFSLKLVDVPGDGNCFYYAIADQLKRQGYRSALTLLPITAQELRVISIIHLLENFELYQDLCLTASYNIHNSIDQYVDYHCQDRSYADEVIRACISRELGLNIAVFSPLYQDPLIQKNHDTQKIICVYHKGAHYQSLIPKNKTIGFNLVTNILPKAIIDADVNRIKITKNWLITQQEFDENIEEFKSLDTLYIRNMEIV